MRGRLEAGGLDTGSLQPLCRREGGAIQRGWTKDRIGDARRETYRVLDSVCIGFFGEGGVGQTAKESTF